MAAPTDRGVSNGQNLHVTKIKDFIVFPTTDVLVLFTQNIFIIFIFKLIKSSSFACYFKICRNWRILKEYCSHDKDESYTLSFVAKIIISFGRFMSML